MSDNNFQATIAWYNQNAEKYANWVDDFYSSEQVATFVSLLPENGRVLDAGCGSGRDTAFLTKAGYQAIGLDLAPGMIEVASKHHPDAEFQVGDFRQTGFPNESFDGVWAHASLINLENPEDVEAAVVEFWRILKPGAVLHLLVKQQTTEQKVLLSTDGETPGYRLVRFFTKEELTSLLNKSGFEKIILETYVENERNPEGRPDVTWIHCLFRKAA